MDHVPRSSSPSSFSTSSRGSRSSELKLAGGRFSLKSKLGSGSFGDIYKGIDHQRRKEVAIKLEHSRARHPQLSYESKVYRLLHVSQERVVGIPEVQWFGQEGDFFAMVMDLCGPCLEDLFGYCIRQFSMKTVLMIADQFLHRIEHVHTRFLIHRDIKPENFVMGTLEQAHVVNIIDFGLSKKFWDSRAKSHMPYRDGKPLTGTARYCSINAHRGIEQSRRDDLESVGYLLVYFAKGSLPWQGIVAPDALTKTTRIGEKKMQTPFEETCRGLPSVFVKYLKYCRGLKFEQQPDYQYLRKLFKDLFREQAYELDWDFDWMAKRANETAPSQDMSRLISVADAGGQLSTNRVFIGSQSSTRISSRQEY